MKYTSFLYFNDIKSATDAESGTCVVPVFPSIWRTFCVIQPSVSEKHPSDRNLPKCSLFIHAT